VSLASKMGGEPNLLSFNVSVSCSQDKDKETERRMP
jgi:hypothetical protein